MKSFRDLRVWQKAMELVEKVYVLTQKFPREETYGLLSQIRRAVVSITVKYSGRAHEGTHKRIPSPRLHGLGVVGRVGDPTGNSGTTEVSLAKSIEANAGRSEFIGKATVRSA